MFLTSVTIAIFWTVIIQEMSGFNDLEIVEENLGQQHNNKTDRDVIVFDAHKRECASVDIKEEDIREYGTDSSPSKYKKSNKTGSYDQTINKQTHSQCRTTSRQKSLHRLSAGEKPNENFPGFKTHAGLSTLAKQQKHSGEKQNQCSLCGRTFSHAGNLKRHLMIHTGVKPHQCTTCGMNFRSSSDLSVHQITHTGEKPHQCSHCGKTFNLMYNLKRHRMIHSGEKPYECATCGNSFRTKAELGLHQITHTGGKPHVCSHCGTSFSQMSDLNKHERIHTGERPYQCSICKKSFKRSTHLTSHQKIHKSKARRK